MCEPTTLALIAAGTAAMSSGVSTYSQVTAGRAQASLQRYNARVAEVNADDAEYRGRVEETQARLAAGQEMSRGIVAAATSGVDISSGSPLSVLEGQAMLNEIDAQIIRSNTERERRAFEQRAVDFRNQARMSDRSATFAAVGGGLDLISSAFQAAGQFQTGGAA